MHANTLPGPRPERPVRCEAATWRGCAPRQDEAASSLQKTLIRQCSAPIRNLLSPKHFEENRVAKTTGQGSLRSNQSLSQVLISIQRVCFFVSAQMCFYLVKRKSGLEPATASHFDGMPWCKKTASVLRFE